MEENDLQKSRISGDFRRNWIKNTNRKSKVDCFFNIQRILRSFFSDNVVVINSKTTIWDSSDAIETIRCYIKIHPETPLIHYSFKKIIGKSN